MFAGFGALSTVIMAPKPTFNARVSLNYFATSIYSQDCRLLSSVWPFLGLRAVLLYCFFLPPPAHGTFRRPQRPGRLVSTCAPTPGPRCSTAGRPSTVPGWPHSGLASPRPERGEIQTGPDSRYSVTHPRRPPLSQPGWGQGPR